MSEQTAESELLNERLFQAFAAGYGLSGEGMNSEYPYGDRGDWDGMEQMLRKEFARWLEQEPSKP